ncbi:MAG: 5'-nucleotidase C-terminal domain-containing protein [Bacteroidetes bacterium]|nr:5'-nucleotidase C-terminal domain-containing protein [Bacteroidota bacterium]
MKINNYFFPFLFLLGLGCKVYYQPTSSAQQKYEVKASNQLDTISDIGKLLKPYRDSLSFTMNAVIGYATGKFEKAKPSGSLGNLVVDILMQQARKIDTNTYGAIYNYGGLRINQIPEGDITRGKIFELLPFDNELVLIEVNGKILTQWLQHIAKSGGWPVSIECSFYYDSLYNFQLQNDTIFIERENGDVEMSINRRTLDSNITYLIATNDYIANGGDNCDFLKGLKRKSTGKLIRDIVLDRMMFKPNLYPDDYQRIILQNPLQSK